MGETVVQGTASCARCGGDPSSAPSLSGLCASCLLQLGLAADATAATVSAVLADTSHLQSGPHLHFAPRSPIPAAGGTLGPYRLLRELGRGGFGIVWEAEHGETGRRVALKVVTEVRAGSAEALERFEREGQLAAAIDHPHCVFVFGAEEIEGYPAITMELMPGGTLQDEMNRRGPIPPGQAVDYVLDALDGLEAALAVGVVHRDVKPSNCFLDEHGLVKIGDFGISKTLEGGVALTRTGSFVGTPVYASPEQARGRTIDFRSDMFSLAGTLYALITGKPPFAGKTAGDVLARVLTEDPPAAQDGVTLPRGLARILRRAMAKDPGKRYRDYASFRAALLPFSSRGLTPAGLPQRLLAYLIDVAILFPLTAALMYARGLWTLRSTTELILLSLFGPPLYYFALTEGLWGRTLGKRFVGLCVTTPAGSLISAPRAWGRALLFHTILTVGGVAQFVAFAQGLSPIMTSLSGLTGFFLILVTMRGRNGYAGLHELLSGSRVVGVAGHDRTLVPGTERGGIDRRDKRPGRFGPYRYVADLTETDDGLLVLASDDVLKRRIWIHTFRDPARALAGAGKASQRPGQLRWLAGSRVAGECWDAFESPSGMSLREWVTRRQRLAWKDARGLLLGLASELSHLPADQPLSIDHLWIDGYGQLKVLAFPADGARTPVQFDKKAFFRQVAVFALEGRLVTSGTLNGYVPAVPLPEHARRMFEAIGRSDRSDSSIASILRDLQRVATRPAHVTRVRRLGPLMAVALPVLLGAFSGVMGILMPMMLERSSDPLWELLRYSTELRRLQQVAQRGGPVSPSEIEAVRKLVAANYAAARNSPFFPQFSNSTSVELWESTRKRYPQVTDAEIEEAQALMTELHPSGLPIFPRVPDRSRALLVQTFAFLAPALIAIPAIFFAVLLSGGLALRISGLVLQTSQGLPAGRLRSLVRALVVWGPFPALFPAFGLNPLASMVPLWMMAAIAAIEAVGFGYTLFRPDRGLPDLIAGTYLMPK